MSPLFGKKKSVVRNQAFIDEEFGNDETYKSAEFKNEFVLAIENIAKVTGVTLIKLAKKR